MISAFEKYRLRKFKIYQCKQISSKQELITDEIALGSFENTVGMQQLDQKINLMQELLQKKLEVNNESGDSEKKGKRMKRAGTFMAESKKLDDIDLFVPEEEKVPKHESMVEPE